MSYLQQPSLPEPPELQTGVPLLIYLDVWERHVTWIDYDFIRDTALGGVDTGTRAELVWQLRPLIINPTQADEPAPKALLAALRDLAQDIVDRPAGFSGGANEASRYRHARVAATAVLEALRPKLGTGQTGPSSQS